MKKAEQVLRNQKNAILFWWIFLIISVLMILSPSIADKLISFEASMAAVFIGIVTFIVSIAMIRIYNNRKRLMMSLFNSSDLLDVWECPDRYNLNKGNPIQAYFSKNGVFFAGKPYTKNSYACIIQGAQIIDDEGAALSIIYTVPSSRMGSFRHKQTVSIPIPEGKEEAAGKLIYYYSGKSS